MSGIEQAMKRRSRLTLLQQRYIFTGIGIFLGVLTLLTPFLDVAEPAEYVGGWLVWAALLEILHGFRCAENQARYSAWFSGAITLLIGILMINAELFQRQPLVDFILLLFLVDACRYLYLFFRDRRKGKSTWARTSPGTWKCSSGGAHAVPQRQGSGVGNLSVRSTAHFRHCL